MPHTTPHNTTAPSWSFSPSRPALALTRSHILAILNVTPDSFSDGGALPTPEAAVTAARTALEHGADMLDIGGESTRPGAARVPAQEQIRRVVPAIEAIRRANIAAPITIDTTLAEVAAAALAAGADAVNDVSAGRDDHDRILTLCAERRAGLILMHRLRPPPEDRYSHEHTAAAPPLPPPPPPPDYGREEENRGVVAVVREFLKSRAAAAVAAGVPPAAIVLDPGLGFGKTVEQNFTLIAHMRDFAALGFPILGAASRKSFIGAAMSASSDAPETDDGRSAHTAHIARPAPLPPPRERITGSVAAAVIMHARGVRLFRVHDVRPHVEALRIADRISLCSG